MVSYRCLQGNLLWVTTACVLLLLAGNRGSLLQGRWEHEDDNRIVAFTFGYGSLLSKPSVASTLCDHLPAGRDTVSLCSAANGFRIVRLKAGLKRGWYASGVGAGRLAAQVEAKGTEWASQQLFLSPQYLGLVPSSGDWTVNGVIYPVTEAQLAKQDQREAGYTRMQIPWETVTFLDSAAPGVLAADPDKALPLYAYVIPKGRETLPRPAAPIAQSYVDIFIGGALDIDAEVRFLDPEYSFTAEALATTYDWSTHWVNDRVLPFRAHAHNPQATDINNALLQHIPHEYLQAVRLPHPLPQDPRGMAGSEAKTHRQPASHLPHNAPRGHAQNSPLDSHQPPRIKRHQMAPN